MHDAKVCVKIGVLQMQVLSTITTMTHYKLIFSVSQNFDLKIKQKTVCVLVE